MSKNPQKDKGGNGDGPNQTTPLLDRISPFKSKTGGMMAAEQKKKAVPFDTDDGNGGEIELRKKGGYLPPDLATIDDYNEEEEEEEVEQEPDFKNEKKKLIDFDAKLEQIKQDSQVNLPYTLTQCEDVMYLDSSHIVTLEFHYY